LPKSTRAARPSPCDHETRKAAGPAARNRIATRQPSAYPIWLRFVTSFDPQFGFVSSQLPTPLSMLL
jgi:hypothetical protein